MTLTGRPTELSTRHRRDDPTANVLPQEIEWAMTPSTSRSCQGKKTFDTKAHAKRNIARWKGSTGARVSNLHAYRCRACDSFHIGSKRKHDRPKPPRFALVIPKTRIPF